MLTYKNVRLAHALLSTAAIVCYFAYGEVFLYTVIALFAVYFIFIVYGVFAVRANFFLQMLSEVNTETKNIALTFDDGPSEQTSKVLDILKHYNIKATFFLVGKKIKGHEDIVHRLLAEGHQMGNHTFHHSNATGFYSLSKLKEELQTTNASIQEVIGRQPTLFRPPFGATSPNLAKAVEQLHMKAIGWSVRSLDTTSQSVDEIANRILTQVKAGSVVLLHDDREKCSTVLETIIPRLLESHFHFKTVGELFNIEAYETR